jgi:hypothetical protein
VEPRDKVRKLILIPISRQLAGFLQSRRVLRGASNRLPTRRCRRRRRVVVVVPQPLCNVLVFSRSLQELDHTLTLSGLRPGYIQTGTFIARICATTLLSVDRNNKLVELTKETGIVLLYGSDRLKATQLASNVWFSRISSRVSAWSMSEISRSAAPMTEDAASTSSFWLADRSHKTQLACLMYLFTLKGTATTTALSRQRRLRD